MMPLSSSTPAGSNTCNTPQKTAHAAQPPWLSPHHVDQQSQSVSHPGGLSASPARRSLPRPLVAVTSIPVPPVPVPPVPAVPLSVPAILSFPATATATPTPAVIATRRPPVHESVSPGGWAPHVPDLPAPEVPCRWPSVILPGRAPHGRLLAPEMSTQARRHRGGSPRHNQQPHQSTPCSSSRPRRPRQWRMPNQPPSPGVVRPSDEVVQVLRCPASGSQPPRPQSTIYI
jgi:hypothetical protein